MGISSFGTDFSFRTSPLADIKESDRLTIDSQAYEVKGVQNHKGVTFAMLDCYLVKVEDAG